MKLSYRGISYDSNFLELPTLETGITAQYRGTTYQLRHAPVEVPLHHPSGIIYQGVTSKLCYKGNFLGLSYYRCLVEFTPMTAEA
jgi:hypothetical protein